MCWVENYSSYLSNQINSNFQYSTDMLPKEHILIDANAVCPVILFQTLNPKKNYFGEDVIEDGKVVYDLTDFKILTKKEANDYKKRLVSIANITGEADERTYYMLEYINRERYKKLDKPNDRILS